MRASLVIVKAPAGATLQDAGRFGWLRYGVTPAGPMDLFAHLTASRLAGHAGAAAALEIGLGGIELEAEGGPVHLGLAGGAFQVTRDGERIDTPAAVVLRPGSRLVIRAGRSGAWMYVAPAGGFDLAPVMGSLSTHTRAMLGPLGGGLLSAGRLLPVTPAPATELREGVVVRGAMPAREDGQPIRLVLGPQADRFTDRGLATLVGATYTLAARSDRMAYRLEGDKLEHSAGFDIVSDGIQFGSIQVPGDGLPLVLMADRQPTGGYPKIATIIRADLGRLAQLRPGERLRFAAVSVQEAVAALRDAHHRARAALERLAPLGAALDLAALASGDHVSGWLDANRADDQTS